jgi:streptogramin lyase
VRHTPLIYVPLPTRRLSGAPVSLGKQLDDMELAGGWLWVAAADSTVSRLDPATGRVSAAPAAVGRHPLALARDGDAVWVASAADHTVQRLAPARH